MPISDPQMKEALTVFPAETLEIRTEGEGQKVLVGCAAPYDKPSIQVGRFVEKFAKGAFYPDPRGVFALNVHDKKQILGRTNNDTVKLEFRDEGVFFRLLLPNTTLGRDVAEQVMRKDVDGISPGMIVDEDEWLEDKQAGLVTRSIKKAKMFEFSLTSFPAYPDTQVALREAEFMDFEKKHAKVVTYSLPSLEELNLLNKISKG